MNVNITCPQCGFSREVSPDRLPAGSAIATCPKCGCRFRLSGPKAPVGAGARPEEQEEDIRVVASRAYAAEAERFEREKEREEFLRKRELGRNPWEMGGEIGWFAAFAQTVMRVMFSPQIFCAGLKPQCQLWQPLAFYMIICVIQTAAERIWSGFFISMLSSAAVADPQLQALLKALAPQTGFALGLLLRCGILAIQLYVFSFLMYLAYRWIRAERASFALVFQIMAYSSAPAILSLMPIIGSIAGWIWGLVCLLVGCKAALRLDWPRTLCGLLPFALLLALLLPNIMTVMGG